MNVEYYYIFFGLLGFASVLMAFLHWAVHSPVFSHYRVRTPKPTEIIPPVKRFINVGMNSVVSLGYLLMVLYFYQSWFIRTEIPSGLTIFGEVLGVLLFYDFMYYFFHRTLHHRKLMKYIHRTHHRVMYPTAPESIYLNPLENIGGITLLFVSLGLLGPVSVVSFLIIFFLHSAINILVHSNLVFPHPIFKLLNYWAVKHDLHHGKHPNKNMASIFPFWDMMFGTYA